MRHLWLFVVLFTSACGGTYWHSALTENGVERCAAEPSQGEVCEEVILGPWTSDSVEFDEAAPDGEVLNPWRSFQ